MDEAITIEILKKELDGQSIMLFTKADEAYNCLNPTNLKLIAESVEVNIINPATVQLNLSHGGYFIMSQINEIIRVKDGEEVCYMLKCGYYPQHQYSYILSLLL